MKRRLNFPLPSTFTTLSAFVTLTACAAALACAAPARAELPEPVARALQGAGIPDVAMGVMVLRGNTVLLSHNAERAMQPASTMKLVTTLVGIDTLGPVFKGRTELRSAGLVVNGVLQGDLILRGGADADFNEDALVHLLEKLRSQGIRKIMGDLVLDRTLFAPARSDVGVAPFDESPEAYYNVIPDALLLNMNMLRIGLDSTGGKLRLDMLPQLDKVTIASDMLLTDGDCGKWDDGWKQPTWKRHGTQITVTLHGTFPRHCGLKTTAVNVLDRHDYAERLFRATWTRLGGSFSGVARAMDGVDAANERTSASPVTRLLADHVSRPLADVLRDINKPSDNGLARTLYLSLGSLETDPVLGSRPLTMTPAVIPAVTHSVIPSSAAGDGAAVAVGSEPAAPAAIENTVATAARAELVVRNWLRQRGIDDSGLVLDNGSGLSRSERVKPVQMAAMLQAAQKSLWMPEFLTSLPIAGLDGTMKRRLKNGPATMRARVKTGALKNVVAIAGYVPDANGELCIVAAMVNHELAGNGNGRKALDTLLEWIAGAAR